MSAGWLYGNAVTPPVAELIGSALVEWFTGEPLLRHLASHDRLEVV